MLVVGCWVDDVAVPAGNAPAPAALPPVVAAESLPCILDGSGFTRGSIMFAKLLLCGPTVLDAGPESDGSSPSPVRPDNIVALATPAPT